MSRTAPAALLSALSNPEVEVFYAVDLAFSSGNIRMWTGFGDKTISSNTYTGTGNLLSIEGLEEASDLSARGTTLTLNAIDSTILSYALTEEYQGRPVTIYWGIDNNVAEIFSGFMDKMVIQDSGETSTIKLSVENKLISLERPNPKRYTRESNEATRQTKSLTGTDTFFDWVTRLQDKQIVWGREFKSGET